MTIFSRLFDEMQLPIDKALFNNGLHTRVQMGCARGQWGGVMKKVMVVGAGKNKKEWKLTFINPQATDANKKTLYLFYTLSGNFIAANFTGQ